VAGPDVARAVEEVHNAGKAWRKARVLTGPAATASEVSRVAAEVDLLHVAAHGRHSADSPLFSGLKLVDGTWHGYDIDQLPHVPQLVVLSACELGRSAVRWGAETLGATVAWQHAGAACVIASPTRVGDDVACEVLTATHSALAAGHSPSDALAAARASAGAEGRCAVHLLRRRLVTGARRPTIADVATIYRSQIRPTKLELLAGWLPGRPWYAAPAASRLEAVGAYRFDDPDGEVGIETHVLRADDGALLQVPLTYRGAPLDGCRGLARRHHGALGAGPRWVYDGCSDPVWATALATVILSGGHEAEEVVLVDGRREPRRPTASVRGSGTAAGTVPPAGRLTVTEDATRTVVRTAGPELTLLRVLDPAAATDGAPVLTGTFAGQEEPVLLAWLRQ
jgi:hypothetical protein